MPRRSPFPLLAFISSVLVACASSSPQPGPLSKAGLPIHRYFPLNHGHIFTYLSQDDSSSSPEKFMIRVRRTAPNTASLVTDAGTRALNISPDAIERVGGGFVLKAPLQQGASWRGDKGLVHVLNVHVRVTVPAGDFPDCIETVEEAASATTKITTFFCANLGIARMIVDRWDGGVLIRQTSDLHSYGPPVDLSR